MKIIKGDSWLFLYLTCTIVHQDNLCNWNSLLFTLILDQDFVSVLPSVQASTLLI